ncbi:HAD family hydrolase [Alicyclobacillus dauci]|uniref:HAD family hydrolase n=1 Tax=Alicyclobacillus dauci TaxID=1475485 RepID=A0ABY6Z1C0_9BACL|nr:HAD family hydrolase [Alicyclobacillus dauci]WAH36026.1 HAD family hydrolase [Alicyclobacillus dauci]
MSSRWLIGTDLDGTLLHHDGKSSKYARSVFRQLHKRGHVIVLASGRHWDTMTQVARDVGVPCYLVASNGAWIGTDDGSVLAEQTLTSSVARIVGRVLENTATAVIVTMDDRRVILDTSHPQQVRRFPWPTSPVSSVANEKIFKLTVTMEDGMMGEIFPLLKDNLGDAVLLARTDNQTIDINALGVSKGQALGLLCDRLDIPISRTVAFGNEMNDATMLQTVEIGVAVADANEALAPYADVWTESSNDDGVAKWLHTFFDVNPKSEEESGDLYEDSRPWTTRT